MQVTPECYARLTHMLCGLAEGRVIMALEGGCVAPVVILNIANPSLRFSVLIVCVMHTRWISARAI